MILDSIRNFIMACPYLKTIDSGVNVNYLSDQADTYSINQEPDEIIIKKYVNGDTLREYNFILVSKEIYTDDVMKNIKISSFYEEFLDWLEEQTNKGNLPNLGENKKAISAEAINNGHVVKVENDKVIYQIKCKLIYLREGEMK
ncbi:chloramphenicol resistance protein [Clostridium sp.]|uniref:chloramphenicol resistance protein n=1 Tax=Clostridium sp. TaxID=1506 RepID=UPI00290CDE71|nr:chloramphenicol resistance protein [Clostridium sp.]MDU3524259.1 chloramphenicol resistance protein [Clostridium sp.]MDU3546288.1 chloramphenicol resistance protein [Clostridium sp.]MDU6363297.1 chloramphenicol resistance protein [Clostridium sp.]